ncbi:hypothetical protein ACPPVU_15440 [Mucilaginibacter sp. McL0603]|uniref:hypothetical protein n=1 Tax=Mucilaginibacter sp. McL0603 TaxID=3415670 RepID=UPI003CF6DF61
MMKTLNKCVPPIGVSFTTGKGQNSFINSSSKVGKAGFMAWEANLENKTFRFHIPVERRLEIKGKLISLYLIFFELLYAIYN